MEPKKKPAAKKQAKKKAPAKKAPKKVIPPGEVNKGGRPDLYSDPEVLAKKIEAYWETIGPQYEKDENGKVLYTNYGKPIIKITRHPSILGLARFLDMGRDTLREYKKKPMFSTIVSRAWERCEEYAVERLMDPDVKPPGIQFMLKNLHGWADESTVKTTGTLTHKGDSQNPISSEIKIILVEPPKTESEPEKENQ